MKPTYFKPSSNPKQFRVFPKDINEAELKGRQEATKELLNEFEEIVNDWAEDCFYWNDDTKQYEQDGLSVHINSLKIRLSRLKEKKQ